MDWRRNVGSDGGQQSGRMNLRSIFDQSIVVLAFLWAAILLPFRLLRAIIAGAAEVTRQIVRASIQLCFALVGIAFIGFVGFGLIRTIFHPLFVQ